MWLSTTNIFLSRLLIAPSTSFPPRLVNSSAIYRVIKMVSGPCTLYPKAGNLFRHPRRLVRKHHQPQGLTLQIAFDMGHRWQFGESDLEVDGVCEPICEIGRA